MGRLRAIRLGAALVALLLGSGCAARWAYRQGQEARDRGEWDLAVARYTKAADKDPNNIAYKIALETAKVQASRVHYDLARRAIAANDWPKAAEELEIASKYDPQNRAAVDDLANVRRRMLRQEAEQRDREEFEARRARAQAAARLPVPVLSPRAQDKIRLQFKATNPRTVFETLGKLANVNVLFDETFPANKSVDVNLTGVTFQEALDQLTFANRLFYKVVDPNTIIIVPENRQKRLAYDELLLRTFYLQNAEVNDTVNLVKSLAKPTGVVGNVGLGAITVVGTVEQVAMAERIIDLNDKPRGEVMVEVQILEVDRNRLKQWGIDLSNYQVAATLSPTGAAGELSGAPGSAGNVLNIRPQFLSSLNQADWVLSLPSTIFVRFLQNDSTSRILAAPRLRAAEGKPTELRIGTEVPIPVTSYTVGLNGGATGGYLPATSFNYRNVGVNLTLTPRVSANGDIQLEMVAEFSSLGTNQNVGSESNPILVPTFNTRNVKGLLRLRDGETGLIGGMLQSNEVTSFAGALGIDSVPVIGKLFGNRSKKRDEMEVLMSITPRIVRGPRITEEDLAPMRVGTQEVPHVEGARPPLFAPEAPAAGTGAPGTSGAAPGATTPPTSSGALPATALPEAAAATTPPATTTAGPLPTVSATAPGTDNRPPAALFSPTEISLRAGQSGGVAVVLVGARDVQSIDMTVSYDPSVLQVTDVSAGSLLTLDGSPVGKQQALEAGTLRVRLTRAAGASGSGAVAALSVRGLKPGSAVLSVESLTVGRAGGATEQPALPAPARAVVTP
ncbi:MAG TPA: cohesin domain-containing protein [Vicinamibacteria bacterium]|nr:cohesin domain-containing protein [Vicinamibacteria bacterium]